MRFVRDAFGLLCIAGIAECVHHNFVMFYNVSSYNSTDMEYTPKYDDSGFSLTVLMLPAMLYFGHEANESMTGITKRDNPGAQVEAQGSGGFISLVSAAGAWDASTLIGVGFCAAGAAFITPGCATALVGAIGLIVQYVISEVNGHNKDSGSVLENVKRNHLRLSVDCTSVMQAEGGLYQECYDSLSSLVLTHHIFGDNGMTRHVVSMDGQFANASVQEVVDATDIRTHKGSKRNERNINWISYAWDNVNHDLTKQFSRAYETNPNAFCKAIAGGVLMAPTTKYCMAMGEGKVDGTHGNAVHGELYTNAYGGIDGYCNQDSDDWGAERCTNMVYIDNNQGYGWGCPQGEFM